MNDKKYEITDQANFLNGRKLYQIRALKDFGVETKMKKDTKK
ncbi:MAG: hypothetical protein Q4C95_12680 [Planctomycetia bacterium]|nr:hypothetical protein [Planctomycetia bacterium]